MVVPGRRLRNVDATGGFVNEKSRAKEPTIERYNETRFRSYTSIYRQPKTNLLQLSLSRLTPSSSSHPFTTQIFRTISSK